MFQNINSKQVATALIAGLAFTGAGSAQLDLVIGHKAAMIVASLAAFMAGLTAAVMAPFMGNASLVRDVGNIDGARVVVSNRASPSIAALAVGDNAPCVVPEKGQEAAVAKVAEGA